MARKILIGLDSSANAMRGVERVARNFGQLADAVVTLFHVLPGLPPQFLEEGQIPTPEQKEARDQLIEAWKKNQETAWEKIFREAQSMLMQHGFKPEAITIKFIPQYLDVAQEILDEAEGGAYDMVVIGRRGLSPVKALLMGSVSRKVTEYGKKFTVVVVD
jgi:nucleotide-binding universal stress UspA family protein